MSIRWTSATALILALTAPAFAAPLPHQAKPPAGPTPQFVIVAAVDMARGIWTTEDTVQVLVPVQETRVVERDGRKIQEVVTTFRPVFRTEHRNRTLVGMKRFSADGKSISEEELTKRVGPGSVVMLASSGALPDEAFRKLVKPDTVILVPVTPEPAPNTVAPAVGPRAVVPGPKP